MEIFCVCEILSKIDIVISLKTWVEHFYGCKIISSKQFSLKMSSKLLLWKISYRKKVSVCQMLSKKSYLFSKISILFLKNSGPNFFIVAKSFLENLFIKNCHQKTLGLIFLWKYFFL